MIKKIKGTKDFWNLEESVRGCQIDHFDICTTEGYVRRVMDSCGCLPIGMKSPMYQKESKTELN